MTLDMDERLVKSVGVLLNLFTVNEKRFPSAEGKIRYNPIDFQTLRYIEMQPECRGVDIARAIGVAPTTQQSALERLIRIGLIKRGEHPNSKRAKIYSLTKDGVLLRQAIHRQDLLNMNAVLSGLSQAEQVELIRILEKTVSKLTDEI